MSDEPKGRVVIVDDDAAGRLAMARALERVGFDVKAYADGMAALAWLREHPDVELIVTDLKMPGIDGIEVLRRAREIIPDVGLLMVTAFASVDSAVEAMKVGSADYLEKPLNIEALRSRARNLVEKGQQSRELRQLRDVLSTVDREGAFEGMVGRAPAMLELYRKIGHVARVRSPVLILGESGSGKELVARAIHRRSARARETFLPLDCTSIPPELLESELFGHERGAFTGAQARKPGKLELAHRGTLFLDEIGDMRPDLQSKLLRAIESQSFMRVGGTEQLHVDVRILAATNRDLARMAETGEFRQDLYYRLAVVTLRVPALRERVEDIPVLATWFLERFAAENRRKAPRLTPEAVRLLESAAWPGNVRELRNLMESLVILHEGEEIGPHHLPDDLRTAAAASAAAAGTQVATGLAGRTMEEIEREAILQSLERTGGNRTQAAEMLGIGLRTLQRKLKQYRQEGYPVGDGE